MERCGEGGREEGGGSGIGVGGVVYSCCNIVLKKGALPAPGRVKKEREKRTRSFKRNAFHCSCCTTSKVRLEREFGS